MKDDETPGWVRQKPYLDSQALTKPSPTTSHLAPSAACSPLAFAIFRPFWSCSSRAHQRETRETHRPTAPGRPVSPTRETRRSGRVHSICVRGPPRAAHVLAARSLLLWCQSHREARGFFLFFGVSKTHALGSHAEVLWLSFNGAHRILKELIWSMILWTSPSIECVLAGVKMCKERFVGCSIIAGTRRCSILARLPTGGWSRRECMEAPTEDGAQAG